MVSYIAHAHGSPKKHMKIENHLGLESVGMQDAHLDQIEIASESQLSLLRCFYGLSYIKVD